MTEDEIDAIYVATTGKTRWEEARASASALGCALLTVIILVVVGFIIIIAD